MSVRKIGICTGGGDCPGLNAVIRGVVRSAIIRYGWQVIGIEDSFDGLIWPNKQRELTLRDASGLLPRGGTILGTTNRGDPFHYKVVEEGREKVLDFSDDVIRNAQASGLDALVVIGGDGTLKIALELYRKGLNLVAVPKTIDNDLSATDLTFGFDTALHTATDAIDKIHTSTSITRWCDSSGPGLGRPCDSDSRDSVCHRQNLRFRPGTRERRSEVHHRGGGRGRE